ncbi:hypothetical protein P6F26_16720 [Roseibacterium sp. SDUM158017]|uniref:hypothetical protein n=1 Tax=Roseicyclus salinarum TaxID=3036773 RepID=UPI002415767A|nr:hypothetical protein [Roseibacterium sp. SDUM158017]MDG4650093.1 hypothetical protein [Roseibacterium sp. SDUM158017]
MTPRDLSYVPTLANLDEVSGVCLAVDCGVIPRLLPYEIEALERRAREIGGKGVANLVAEIRRRSA